ncbi:hypothetical protein BX661DRAFT_171890 [Kickxella alabastrina]|uniref:uncharacterized protein n=1 Tax=Kickxella alabastrina TaxID=61397 RepID=UPI00221E3C2F|nr:uncharacterized protein BX661DRAFT_171890 [Kickxella alabastrina]KAI7825934.1 hypothetical protein BX661DRAFT_171890 [Kickxella alabastrina]KAJ1947176.1 mdj1 protein precursor [Kickxella alabastrina]
MFCKLTSSSKPLLHASRTIPALARHHYASVAEPEKIFSGLKSDAYTTLGVDERSSADEIKARYYKLCRELHPDTIRQTTAESALPKSLGIGDTQWKTLGFDERKTALRDRFVKVQAAYEVLSDAELRHKYNMYRRRRQSYIDDAQKGSYDVWGQERPPAYHDGRQKTEEERRNEKRIMLGILGFTGVLAVIMWYQELVKHEDVLRISGMEHLRSMRMMSDARERAKERWREVPPDHAMEYEARRLQNSSRSGINGGDGVATGEYHKIWPHGAGLGLMALLEDNQLCGVESRKRAGADPEVLSTRQAARHALEDDSIVHKYMALPPPSESPVPVFDSAARRSADP